MASEWNSFDGRGKPQAGNEARGAFLGTDDIVRRLRATQPANLSSLTGRAARRLGQMALGAAVAALGAFFFYHPGRPVADRSLPGGQLAAAAGAAQARPETVAAVASHLAVPAAGAEAAPARVRAEQPPAAQAGAAAAFAHLQMRVTDGASNATLWVDGHLAAAGSFWQGNLPQGPHRLLCRSRHGEQELTVTLGAEPREVLFACRTGHFLLQPASASHRGRRAGRAADHAAARRSDR